MHRKHKLILALTLIIGIAFVVIMVKLKQPPQRVADQVTATPVTTIEVTPFTLRTEARGYGQVLPARSWKVTTSTTVAGLLPLLAETSTQAMAVIPLVISVVFGLLVSTVVILVALPALYAILEDLGWARVPNPDKP